MVDMTSLQRVLTTLGHSEPDRVPLFLLVTTHGARELGVPIRDYLTDAAMIAEGQIRMRRRYGHDCLYSFTYAAIEAEAFGGESVFYDDGPPNAGEPFLRAKAIPGLSPPDVRHTACLVRVLEAIAMMKEQIGDGAPIIGVVMSPFSLPVMQMGFGEYLDIMHGRLDLFERLMAVNEEFCVAWANAQLAAGATAICYFDPVSSPTIVTPHQYTLMGKSVATRTLARINGPTATHMASGRVLAILDDVADTGTAAVAVGDLEDMAQVKKATAGRLSVLGNLDGIEMRRWSQTDAVREVKRAIAQAGPGGGFVLSDQHGEIPCQVPEDVLAAVADAAREWGRYPLTWVGGDA